MKTFTSSHGVEVRETAAWIEVGELSQRMDITKIEALREFFQAERDEELGRWRYPEDDQWLVYPDGEDSLGNRHVVTIWEKNGRRDSVYENNIPGTVWGTAARAYFEAHPERKPWHDAKTGEIWVITFDGEESAWTVNNAGRFENPDSTFELTAPRITAGRRIWPESD